MKKVLIITYYWPPETSVGALRWYYFSKYLPSFGYNPIIYTTHNSKSKFIAENPIDNDIQVIRKTIFDPSNIFSKITGSNINQGVLSNTNSLFIKLLNWIRVNFFIPDSRKFWINSSVSFLSKFIKKNNINTIITTGPPHSIHLIGYRIKNLHKINWIADFRDPWSSWDILKEMNPNLSLLNKHKELEMKVLKSADKILVTNKNLAKEFQEKIDLKKITIITNGTLLKFKNNKYDYNKFKISYLGLMNKLRYPEIFFDSLKEIIINNDDIGKELEIFISGPIDNSIYNNLKNDNILGKYLNYVEYVDYEKTFYHYKTSSLLLLLLNKNSINTTPTKIFDYAISGKKILTLGNKSDENIDSLLKEFFLDKRIMYSDKNSIKKIILESYKNYKNKKRFKLSHNLKKYDRKYLTEKLSKVLNSFC